jgi:hypothetical protein
MPKSRSIPANAARTVRRSLFALSVAASAVAAPRIATVGHAVAQTASLPAKLSDQDFWKFITDASEPGGYFRSDNFLSNEAGFQYVIPELQRITKPGGVYLGVGPEQNFTYIAALKPRMAIIFDIRRGNLHEHMLYKALFEQSSDRADFLSRLFARPRPTGLDTSTAVDSLFSAYRNAVADTAAYRRNLAAVKELLVTKHGFALTSEDLQGITYVADALFGGGPTIDYSYPNSARGRMPSYADLMVQNDGHAQQRSFLATEANFRVLKDLESKNLVIPVVGDFGGPKAIRAVGKYLKDHGATVTAFYTSNVEQYLFREEQTWRNYYENVATLPLDSTSMFIRSIGGNFGFQAPPGAPFGRLPSVMCSMQTLITAFREGKITQYGDVIQMSK